MQKEKICVENIEKSIEAAFGRASNPKLVKMHNTNYL